MRLSRALAETRSKADYDFWRSEIDKDDASVKPVDGHDKNLSDFETAKGYLSISPSEIIR